MRDVVRRSAAQSAWHKRSVISHGPYVRVDRCHLRGRGKRELAVLYVDRLKRCRRAAELQVLSWLSNCVNEPQLQETTVRSRHAVA